jgi:magnesium transporter
MLGKALQPEIEGMIEARDLDTLRETLSGLETADIAEILEDLPDASRAVVFRVLPHDLASDVFEHLPFEDQEELIRDLSTEDLSRILNDMAPDDRTALLEELPGNLTQRLLKTLNPGELRVARTLLGYPEESIGRLMTPEYVSARLSWTVQETLDHIRRSAAGAETISYIYVVDEQGRLIDDIHLSRLVMADPQARLKDLVEENVVVLHALEDREEAVATFKKYDRIALPVVDQSGVLLGIVTVDDVFDVEEEEATEDMQLFAGQASLEDSYLATEKLVLIRKRLGWLTLLFIGGLATSRVISQFGDLLQQFVILSFFIPLVISSGGNSGSQSASLMIRSLAIKEISPRDWFRIMRREVLVGFAMGCVLGLILASLLVAIALFERRDFDGVWPMTLVAWCSVTSIVTLGTITGALLPLLLKKIGLDPAISSAPAIATFVDISGITIYLLIASLILG